MVMSLTDYAEMSRSRQVFQNQHQPENDFLTSTTLLGRVAGAGDGAAERAFVKRYTPMVRAVARACGLDEADVDDLGQEVMIAAVEALRRDRYDRERSRFRLFLKGIIAHKIRDTLAGKRREGRIQGAASLGILPSCPGAAPGSSANELPDSQPSPAEVFEAVFEAEWRKAAIDEALDVVRREVEPDTFQAFDLYVCKGMLPGEVARLLGVPRNTIYISKTRVIARIREILNAEHP